MLGELRPVAFAIAYRMLSTSQLVPLRSSD
jgi:hypothetical protein